MTLPQLRGHLRAIRSQERQNDRMLLYITRAAGAVPEDFKEFLKSL
ncbi:hypothetical protein [Pseudomonas sp. 2023EL-01195]|jgi:hypothetical protein|nr:hypothetical protein [Pseudomonas sp. 2023EL-01195]MDW3716742.1 hypothetical protein [Pseudomonas sp. 2023EL-01195]